jgi:hypothetical protein
VQPQAAGACSVEADAAAAVAPGEAAAVFNSAEGVGVVAGPQGTAGRQLLPDEQAGVISKLFFNWAGPLLTRGNEKVLAL